MTQTPQLMVIDAMGNPPHTPRFAPRLARINAPYLALAMVALSLSLLLATPARAISLQDLMNATMGQSTPTQTTPAPTPKPAAAPAVTVKTPAPAATPAAPAATPVPASAALPDNKAAATTQSRLALSGGAGSCGLFGATMGGCPEGGVVAPRQMPELKTTLASLGGLMNTLTTTDEQKRDLVRLASRLAKIDPARLKAQTEALAKSAPAQQFGALKMIEMPETYLLEADPRKPLAALVTDATGSGSRIEGGVQRAASMLRAMSQSQHSKDPLLAKEIAATAAKLEKLAQSRAVSAAAKQAFKPFYNENGGAHTHPLTRKPITPEDIASSLMMLSLEKEQEPYTLTPASVAHDASSALDEM